jgi:hypothetical protein
MSALNQFKRQKSFVGRAKRGAFARPKYCRMAEDKRKAFGKRVGQVAHTLLKLFSAE